MAKLYRIRDWENLYENSRSRKVEDLRWVPIPNRHDGETFSLIMAHPDGSVIFSAWILLVQIASKCNPRGTLVRDNGSPHSAISLSAKCRAPATWFETALNYLETQTDWVEVEEVTTERHSPTTRLAPAYQPSAEEGKEGNGKKGREGNGEHSQNNGHAEIPSWEEFWAYCQSQTLVAEWYARDKFLAAEQDNWKGKSNWRPYVTRCRAWWEEDGRPMTPQKSKSNGSVRIGDQIRNLEKLLPEHPGNPEFPSSRKCTKEERGDFLEKRKKLRLLREEVANA